MEAQALTIWHPKARGCTVKILLRLILGFITRTSFAGIVLGACLGSAQAQVVNGDFETGDLPPWVTYVTPNGSFGQSFPSVSIFDVRGDGVSSSAFSLSVGYETAQCSAPGFTCPWPTEGGGIRQTMVALGGRTVLHADVAVANSTASGGFNGDGGTFSLFLDGVLLDSVSFVEHRRGNGAERTT